MVGAVEKVMNSVSDGMAREWRTKDKEEQESEERARRMDMRDVHERWRGTRKEKEREDEST
jgi:hypothetical protein